MLMRDHSADLREELKGALQLNQMEDGVNNVLFKNKNCLDTTVKKFYVEK